MDELLKRISFADVELWRILAFFITILVAFIIGRTAKYFFNKTSERLIKSDKEILGVTFKAISRSVTFIALVFGLSFAVEWLKLDKNLASFSSDVIQILFVAAICTLLFFLVEVPVHWMSKKAEKTESKLDDMLVPIIRKSLRLSIIVLGLVQAAQILSDKPITSILAGLGIGGLALALAAQDTLKNFFGSIVIFIDKPFQVSDRVIIDGFDGSVEEVGLRSTKIRTLDGHLITIPNAEIANKPIQNIGNRPFIRRVADITITYDTKPEKIDRALQIIKNLLKDHKGMNPEYPPRVYFNDLASTSLNIRAVYWFFPPDYWEYMEFTEWFNKEIFRIFGEEGIEFAFPTQTVFLAGDPNRPLNPSVIN